MTDSRPLAVVTGASSGIGRELARSSSPQAAAKVMPGQARAAVHAQMTKLEGE